MSSAIDYLRELHNQLHDNKQWIPPDLLKHRVEQFEEMGSVYASRADTLTIEGRENFLYNSVVKPLLTNIPPKDAHALVDIPVGLLPIYEPNAWALQTPGGENLIAMHTELAAVISFYSELQCAVRKIYNETGKKPLELHREGLEAVFQSFLQQREVAFPVIPVKLTFEELALVQMLTYGSQLFILAHEFAHVALGHTGDCVSVRLEMGTKPNVRKVNWEQQQELDADLRAFEWLCHLKGKDLGVLLRLAAKSPITSLQFLLLLHLVEAHVGFPDATSTHPPALERLNHIACGARRLLSDPETETLSQWISTTEQIKSL